MSDDKVEMLMVSLLQTIDKRLDILCTDNDVLKDRQDQALATITDLDGRLQHAIAQMEVIARILASVMGEEAPSTPVPTSTVSPFASPTTLEAAPIVEPDPIAAPIVEAAPVPIGTVSRFASPPALEAALASAPLALPEFASAPLAVARPNSALASPSRPALQEPAAPAWVQHAARVQDAPLLAAAPQPATARDSRSSQQTSTSGLGEMNLSAFADLLNTGLIDLFAEQPA